MSKHDLLGQKVANDGLGLRKALEEHYQVKSLEHVGNFMFRAELENGRPMLITTKPVDLAMQMLRITAIIRVEEGGRRK